MNFRSCFVFFFAVCLSLVVHSQEMSFEQYNPVSTLVVPTNEVRAAKYPCIDIHSHHFRMATQDLSEVVGHMDRLNLAVLVNLSGGSGQNLRDIMANVNASNEDPTIVFLRASSASAT